MHRNEFLKKSVSIVGIPLLAKAISRGGIKQSTDIAKIKELLLSPTGKNWVFTGDSVTAGVKHTYGFRSYPEIFSERIRFEIGRRSDFIINTAVDGNNSGQIIRDFPARVAQFSPSVVSVMLGINDCADPATTEDIFKENLYNIIKQTRELNAIPLLHTPNRIDERPSKEYASREKLSRYVEIVREVTKENQTILIDNWKYWEDYDYLNWLDDSLHPNHFGHLEIARQIFITLSIFDKNSFTCSGEK